MARSLPPCLLWLLLILPAAVLGGPAPRLATGPDAVLGGGLRDADKAALVDTVLLMGPWGSGSLFNGQFEDPAGTPDLLNDPDNGNAWTSRDLTLRSDAVWHADTFHALAGAWSAWCGEIGYPACSPEDVAGGYGNDYDERLDWTATVADPGLPATVRLTGLLECDTEPGYDFVVLVCGKLGQPDEVLLTADGNAPPLAVDRTASYQPGDYLGDGGDEVLLRWIVTSDQGWSDEDCYFYGAGACRVDDLAVTLSQGETGTATFDDFEDGTLGTHWAVSFPDAVGDFAKIWTGLEDLDPCATDYSAQVAFIDDGLVVPGTDGTYCINWCYGPGGYIVNNDGGLLGPGHYLSNVVESPVMTYPVGDFGHALLSFDVFRHENLGWESPAILFNWAVRSSSVSAADLQDQPWRDRNFLYYGGPGYQRFDLAVGDLLVPGRRYVQVRLGCLQQPTWGWDDGKDGTPAPYFDNVRLAVAPYAGPVLSALTAELANDGFPAGGTIDMSDPGALDVRFDMAANIAPPEDLHLDPGDSIVTRIVAVRAGAAIQPTSVRLVYALDANPVFDGWRGAGLPASGSVPGVPASRNGVVSPDLWAFDLPDEGFLFPGDVLHYYVEAADDAAGDVQVGTLPADLTGFGEFGDPPLYDPRFTVRALPGLDAAGHTRQILIWVDGGEAADWHEMMATLHLGEPFPYDLYTTREPDSGLGNGLGAVATSAQLAGYSAIVYTAGDLGRFTLCNGDFEADASADLGLLDAWLRLGYKGLFLCGDNLATDLATNAGLDGADFLGNVMGLTRVAADLRPLIGAQVAPLVLAPACYPQSWVVYGGCPGINAFDAVEPLALAVRLAEFTDPNHDADAYSYAATTRYDLTPVGSRVISTPYDLPCVMADPDSRDAMTDLATRQLLLHTTLEDLFVTFPIPPEPVPGAAARFNVAHGPNPFNPIVRFAYTLPREDRLTVTIHNVRGARVRVLHDEPTPAGAGVLTWDGTDDGGKAVASGVYFYSARTSKEEMTGKLTLVK